MKIETGQVAVVTGGASGIGLELCHEFGRRGMAVVAADIEADALAAAVGALRSAGIDAIGKECDVTSMDSVQALADECFAWKGNVHVVCNNAGVVAFGDAMGSLEDWKWVIDVDLWGVVHGLFAFGPRMREAGEPGHFVNTASTAGLLGFPGIAPYVAAKHAVVGMTQSLWHELQPTALSASVLCPGIVSTNINTSERNRPGVAAGSVERSGAWGDGWAEAQTAEEVAVIVADAVEADQFWVIPHEAYGGQALTLAQGRIDKQPPLLPVVHEQIHP
ncbi:SDR family NAD(P)-dependent oxidoreductase [Ilumatobacter nonamiensis]|uniref:SDR family NAD(P)-dependent oxidoreductase n=1 Tax=Ilumatobacter nonamiensis TaxID=467093 RepID=UPI0003491B72|nr:SDR family NAD(P)-dependent oxidoreductase [Ilumatobacter nonamiensis]